LDRQKAVYLRNRVAEVAARLETLPAGGDLDAMFELLAEEEPGLADLEVIERAGAGDRRLEPLWEGLELFRTESVDEGGRRLFRAWLPFHAGGGLRIARIDLDAAAADFLVVHARHNVMVASAAGLALVLLALYAIWSAQRAARLEVRQLEVEHLAHMGKMAAVLAHEIRNPLGTIKGFAQLAGEGAGTETRALLDPIVEEARRLEGLVNDLLLYGRPPVPSLRRANWEETRRALEAHALQFIGDRPIRFEAAPRDAAWETDPRLLQQALLNLVRNAVDAAAAGGGRVRLEMRTGRGVELAVIDNGPGIALDVRDRVGEAFVTTKASGTGLGLAITRKLAAALGGELILGPAKPGGTEAVLRFPGAVPGKPGREKHGNDPDCG
jgi:signal transduction histidine kinase